MMSEMKEHVHTTGGRLFAMSLVLFLAATTLTAGEIVVCKDGTVIRGEIVGFEQGSYLIKIGGYTKKVGEERISEIRDDDTSCGATDSNAAVQDVVTSGLRPSGGSTGNGTVSGTDMMSQLLQLNKLQQSNPTMKKLLELQGMKGTKPLTASDIPADMAGELGRLQSNPAMASLMQRFKDPAFQKTMLDNIKKMRRALNPGTNPDQDPNIIMLEGLFRRLNSLSARGAGQSSR